jgi:hypothetical protein
MRSYIEFAWGDGGQGPDVLLIRGRGASCGAMDAKDGGFWGSGSAVGWWKMVMCCSCCCNLSVVYRGGLLMLLRNSDLPSGIYFFFVFGCTSLMSRLVLNVVAEVGCI